MTTGTPAATGAFEEATAVERVEGGWTGRIDPAWNIGANPNGGYTLAMVARAMLAEADRPDPLTLTAHYVAPPVAGPAEVRTEIVRAGRRYATVEGQLVQGSREMIRVLGALGDLTAQQGPTQVAASMPSVPPPDECVAMGDLSGSAHFPVPEVMHRYDLRLDPGCQWVRARRAGPQDATGGAAMEPLEIVGWARFADGAPPSALGLVAMADGFPPTVLGSLEVGWIPTIELTVHIRARPVPGWILGVIRTRLLVDGLLEEDGELWDSAGRLVALSRQLALILPRR